MFGGIGPQEIMLIFLVVLLLFGAKRIPEIGSAMGKGIREFKSSVREIEGELKTPPKAQDQLPAASAPAASTTPPEAATSQPTPETGSANGTGT
jgi:sec-independent protein translocase protein TatA